MTRIRPLCRRESPAHRRSPAASALLVALLVVLLVVARPPARAGGPTTRVARGRRRRSRRRMDELAAELARRASSAPRRRAGAAGSSARSPARSTSTTCSPGRSRRPPRCPAPTRAVLALDARRTRRSSRRSACRTRRADVATVAGPPDGAAPARSRARYRYGEERGRRTLDPRRARGPARGEATSRSAILTVFAREPSAASTTTTSPLEELALRAGPAIENARRFREARQLADLDALTGLHNRRYFHETLDREFARAHRYERRLALIVFDLDDFKDDQRPRSATWPATRVLAEVGGARPRGRPHGRHRLPRRRRRVRGHPPRVAGSTRPTQLSDASRARSRPRRSARPAGSRSRPASPSSSPGDDSLACSSAPTRRSTARRTPARAASRRSTRSPLQPRRSSAQWSRAAAQPHSVSGLRPESSLHGGNQFPPWAPFCSADGERLTALAEQVRLRDALNLAPTRRRPRAIRNEREDKKEKPIAWRLDFHLLFNWFLSCACGWGCEQ